MGEIKLVTFDLDGTTLDNEWAHEEAKRQIAASIGAIGDLELPRFTGKSNRLFWQYVLEKFQIDGDIEELTACQFQKVAELVREAKQPESEGLTETLKWLKKEGIKVAITSGSDEYFIDEITDYLGTSQYYDIKVTKDQVKRVKPDPDIYLKAQEMAGIDGVYAIGVEDSNAGCEALHRAGMRCVGYTNQGKNPQSLEKADWRVPSMLNIIDIVKQIRNEKE